MSFASRNTVKDMCDMVIGVDGTEPWEPTFREILERYTSERKSYDKRKQLTRLLIARVRRKLKKEGLYFYCVANNGGGKRYKILESSQERLDVTKKLFDNTNGYIKSTHSLLEDTMAEYPSLTQPFITRIRARLDTIKDLAYMIVEDVEERTK